MSIIGEYYEDEILPAYEEKIKEAVELLKRLKKICEEEIEEFNIPELNDFLNKNE